MSLLVAFIAGFIAFPIFAYALIWFVGYLDDEEAW